MATTVTNDGDHDIGLEAGGGSPRSFWQRHRLPLILGVIAVCFYICSIVAIVYGRGAAA